MTRLLPLLLALGSPVVAEDRALVIGIDDYSALSEGTALNAAVADADRFTQFLQAEWNFAPDQIATLRNPTSEHILSTLIDQIVGQTVAGDRVVVYFAGLGTTLPDGTPALIASDAHTLLGKIPMTVISDMLGLLTGRDVTVILDTSFDGNPAVLGGTIPRGLPADAAASAITNHGTLWTAADTGQFAWEDVDRGVFTHLFTQAWQDNAADRNGDGALTNAEIHDYLTQESQDWCNATETCASNGGALSPQFDGPADAIVGHVAKPAIEPTSAPVTTPIMTDDGLPPTYRETLGFVTDLFAPSNEAGLSLAMNGDARIGASISFTVTADKPGSLILLDVNPDGALSQVFPLPGVTNASTLVTPDTPLTIPNGAGANGQPLRMTVSEPAGAGILLALHIAGDLPAVNSVLPASLANGPVPNAGQSLYELAQRLLALESDAPDTFRWSATHLPYRIEP